MQDRPMNFNETQDKNFIDMASDSAVHQPFKKLLFWCGGAKTISYSFGVVSSYLKKAIQIVLPFQLHISLQTDFLHILQPQQHTTTGGMQKQL